jgi:hypothetical protein
MHENMFHDDTYDAKTKAARGMVSKSKFPLVIAGRWWLILLTMSDPENPYNVFND